MRHVARRWFFDLVRQFTWLLKRIVLIGRFMAVHWKQPAWSSRAISLLGR
jgi:hypothetical protein